MTAISTSTSAFFDRAKTDIGTLRKRAETLQEQLGGGDKLARSSDDPVAASRLRILARADSLSDVDRTNSDRANADFTLADSALSTFSEYVIRAKELATLASNGTLTTAQRAGIGEELSQLYGNLVGLANSRDSNGHALFGGESSGDAYTLDGSGNASYVGTASAGNLALGDGQSINRGITGPEFLEFDDPNTGTSTDLLSAIKALGAELKTGAAPQAAAQDGMRMLDTALDKITTGQTLIGSRLNWVELTNERRTNLGELRADEQTTIGATDLPSTIAELQQTMTVLEASQASFTKLAGLNLFDLIR
jgi:flagellar hook-associated protein 3 FlgL